ncbi:hypothetical protein [Serratia marcescens]|uniref:Ead/Ea22-like family protein n=1 Tax=Serratia marcescens TaxID=615 RepID=A0ABD5BC64_SERMA|nr:hypothetical protein [Serratia marcescens]MDQ9409501.1 hypothetical protein [Serratia marcescens]MDQ9533071.1 hypothetical protein [Serratia marcescens]MDQ9544540.1 hypothetical protein [Serratia marcescens]MDQ9554123.1 hypothetical protein [Serratia marcescens]MDQ9575675.1 hypothetical protein [Serratia marcescens]
MDNKLSELSKPVDFLKSATLITARNFERWSKLSALTAESSSVLHSITLLETSQLLFALLEELEAKDKRIAELEAIQADASQVFKEIGNELGCNPDNESIMMAIDALKERLATPVRLPDSDIDSALIMAHWCSNEEVNAWVKGINYAKQQIRAAGFTVEGDDA